MMVQKRKTNCYAMYSIVFCITALLCFSYFIRYEKSMVWGVDSLYQHYNAFEYLGIWLREIISTLIKEGKLVIPMWEWGFGYGLDVVQTLNYYVIGDPFALISVFFPAELSEYGFALSIILRFYCSGLAFCKFTKSMSCETWSSVAASMLYVFSAFTLHTGVRHPYFLNPCIFLPLLLCGVEKIRKKQSPIGYVAVVFLATVSNYYFFYMEVLLVVIYVLLTLWNHRKETTLQENVTFFLRLAGYSILGVCLGAWNLIPAVVSFLGNPRISDSYVVDLLYTKKEYRKLLGSFVGLLAGPDWAYIGLAPIAYLGIFGDLVMRKKETRLARWYLGVMLLILVFPMGGHIFNGFGYVCNRWVFAWDLVVCWIFAKTIPFIIEMKWKDRLKLVSGAVIYVGILYICDGMMNKKIKLNVCILLFTCLVYLCSYWFKDLVIFKKRITSQTLVITGVLLLCIMTPFALATEKYSHRGVDYLNPFVSIGQAHAKFTGEPASLVEQIDNPNFYRVDAPVVNNQHRNYLISQHIPNTTIFWSVVNSNLTDFMLENDLSATRPSYAIRGLYGRSWIRPLFSCEYFVANDAQLKEVNLPYGSVKEDIDGENYHLYRTDFSLPFGYTYDQVVQKSELESLTASQKQQVYMQAAVIEDEDDVSVEHVSTEDLNYVDQEIPYTFKYNEDEVAVEDGKIIIKKPNVDLSLQLQKACTSGELYVEFRKLKYKGTLENTKKEIIISAYSKGKRSAVSYYPERHKHAEHKENYLLNLGYTDEARENIRLHINLPGEYTFDELVVTDQSMEPLGQYVNDRREECMEQVSFPTNQIRGTITVSGEKALCFSMPYADGWRIWVDGKETKLLRMNMGLCGVTLSEGQHEIRMAYATPGLKIAVIISACTGVFCIVLLGVSWKRRKKYRAS